MSIQTQIERIKAAKISIKTAIEGKGVTVPDETKLDGMPELIEQIEQGQSEESNKTDVNFYDYDGTLLYSYTLREADTLASLPDLPTKDGLVCQGWNWTLDQINAEIAKTQIIDVGAMYITDDGKTRIYIHLEDGRLSPMLGLGVNGTVTVEWGDGSTSELTGTSESTAVFTDNHTYEAPGDYVISLTVDGIASFLGISNGSYILQKSSSASTNENKVYVNSIHNVEIGSGITRIGSYAFNTCCSLTSIVIPSGVTIIDGYAFQNCYSLTSIVIPSGVTIIDGYAFQNCYSLTSIVIPSGVTRIESAVFYKCYGVAYYDFSNHTSVPTLSDTNAFADIPSDCQIRVPAALVDEWKAATNWATYADYIVGV